MHRSCKMHLSCITKTNLLTLFLHLLNPYTFFSIFLYHCPYFFFANRDRPTNWSAMLRVLAQWMFRGIRLPSSVS